MLGATPACIPSWIHAITAERIRAKAAGVLGKALGSLPGCQVTGAGIVSCEPEAMRSRTEARIKALGLYPRDRRLSLDAYSIARNVKSEAGSGSIPEKVVMALAAIDRAAADDKGSISRLVMKNGTHYGKQSGTNPSVSSSHDPTWEEIVIAEMALAGVFGDFSRGATHYFSPRIMDAWKAKGKDVKDRFGTYETWSHGWGSSRDGYAWVGPIPGIDHNDQFLMRKVALNSAEWKAAYTAGLQALGQKVTPPVVAHAEPCVTAEDYHAGQQASALGVIGSLMIAMFFGGSLGVLIGSYFGPEATSSRRASERRRI